MPPKSQSMSVPFNTLLSIRTSIARRPPPNYGLLFTARPPLYHRCIHTVRRCPPATCSCRETPLGLDIDYQKPLGGTVPSYAQHVVVSTGRSNWPSKIEDDTELPLVTALKTKLGRDGKFSNVSLPMGSAGQTSPISLCPEKIVCIVHAGGECQS